MTYLETIRACQDILAGFDARYKNKHERANEAARTISDILVLYHDPMATHCLVLGDQVLHRARARKAYRYGPGERDDWYLMSDWRHEEMARIIGTHFRISEAHDSIERRSGEE